jgi:hypothetical protein
VRWSTLAIWAAISVVAVVSCSLNLAAAHIGSEYFPVGHDGFYHARRILDTVANPAGFYEFDPKIHAPEGSLLVWPWGYDYLMATVVRVGLALGLGAEPIKILIWIPVAAVTISIGLLVLIGRRLSLSNWAVALAGLCMALAPTTQLLHGVGNIDHHYAELICILAALSAGLAWFRQPNVTSAIALGAVFGGSVAIHNGLFVVQIPFLITLLAGWLQGRQLPLRPIVVFAATLLLVTAAVLIPSEPFRRGQFEFYTLSWFHLYIAGGTALATFLFARIKPSRINIAAMIVLAAMLLAPLINEIRIASSFLDGSLGNLEIIEEMRSPVTLALEGSARSLVTFYSWLIWLAPLTLLLCVVQCWRERASPRLLFWVSSALGLVLMSTQIRMHYFGGFALYLPWLVFIDDYATKRPPLQRRTHLIATLALLLAYVPQIRHALIDPIPRAADLWFERLHPIFAAMREACAKDPGVVLADSTAGHYIRYYTECSVIANNFLLTKQQFDKADEVQRLFSLSAAELPTRAPYVKYVLVRPANIIRRPDGEYTFAFFSSQTPQLAMTLLLEPPSQVPSQYRLIDQVRFELRYKTSEFVPYARFYKIETGAPELSSDASLNEVSN